MFKKAIRAITNKAEVSIKYLGNPPKKDEYAIDNLLS